MNQTTKHEIGLLRARLSTLLTLKQGILQDLKAKNQAIRTLEKEILNLVDLHLEVEEDTLDKEEKQSKTHTGCAWCDAEQ